jgi:2-(1,2-epoxy-1,2-dihydrophenyl)acetyl-CoA isomerase
MSYETIQLEMRGAVSVLTLNRPERLNALTVAVGKEFQSAVGEARELVILPRLIGWKRAAELMFTGDMVSAEQAWQMGMINDVVPDAELMPKVLALADRLASAPTAAIGRIKMLLEASATNDYSAQLELEREAQIESGQTKDFVEGVAAFLEKRPPGFVGG